MDRRRDRQLAVGVLGVRLGLATADQVVDALEAWLDGLTPGVGSHLEACGALTPEQRRRLEALAAAEEADDTDDGSYATGPGADTSDQTPDDTLAAPSPSVRADPLTLTPEHPGRYATPDDGEPALLGRGGVGRVLRAFDRHLGREIAIKELLDAAAAGDEIASPRTSPRLARFVREARITAQLEHPSIVPVHELGCRADGALYYTMKRVVGRTLEQALGDAQGLPGRLALTGHVLALCHAMAYAHARGVVHRDIKAANVMVGPFGETVVLDWGLARARAAEEPPGSGTPPPPPAPRELAPVELPDDGLDGGRTVAGTAFGTPATMSPEQARGDTDAIDERSDVWSLGAVLYHLLTGRPPFVGETAAAVVALAREGIVPPVRTVEPDAPPELAAIAERALRRAPDERYQSAREMAEDLEAWTTGRRVGAHTYTARELLARFVRRHRVPVAIVAVALAVLAAAGLAAYLRVVAARDRATAQRDAARGLAGYLVHDVSDAVAAMAGAGALRREVLSRALTWYRQSDADGATPGERRDLALGTLRVAALALEAGSPAVAAEALDDAGPILRGLLEVEPHTGARLDYAEWLDARAQLAEARGRTREADAWAGEAVRTVEAALAKAPGDERARRALARGATRLGRLTLTRGETVAAGRWLERAVALEVALLEEHPRDGVATRGAVASHRLLAELALARDHKADAEGLLRRALQLGEARLSEAPADADAQAAVIGAQAALGDVLHRSRARTAEAVELLGGALAAAERLATADPWSSTAQREVSHLVRLLCAARVSRGEAELARGLAERAVALDEALLARDPSPETRRSLAASLRTLGERHWEEGDLDGARALLERALTIHRALAQDDPASAAQAREAALAAGVLADQALARGDLAAAEELAAETAARVARLRATDPDNRTWARDATVVSGRASAIALAAGRLPEARQAAERCVAERRALAAQDPADMAAGSDLVQALEQEARVAAAQGEVEAGLDRYEEAITRGEAMLAQLGPDQADRRRGLLASYTSAGRTAAWLGRPERARRWYEALRALGQALVTEDPEDVEALRGLGFAQYHLGEREQALGTVRRLRTLSPGDPTPAVELVEALVLAGRAAEAAREAPAALALAPPCEPLRPVAVAWAAIAQALAGAPADAAATAREGAGQAEGCPGPAGAWSFEGAAEGLPPGADAAATLLRSLACDGVRGCVPVPAALRAFAAAVAPAHERSPSR